MSAGIEAAEVAKVVANQNWFKTITFGHLSRSSIMKNKDLRRELCWPSPFRAPIFMELVSSRQA
jgi:hypothetical protein